MNRPCCCFVFVFVIWFLSCSSACLLLLVLSIFLFLFEVSDYSVNEYYLYANILHRNFLRFTPLPPPSQELSNMSLHDYKDDELQAWTTLLYNAIYQESFVKNINIEMVKRAFAPPNRLLFHYAKGQPKSFVATTEVRVIFFFKRNNMIYTLKI